MTKAKLKEKIEALNVDFGYAVGNLGEDCTNDTVEKLLSLFDSYFTQEVERAEKAYGGCHKCYGKGYSTEAHAEIAFADFGDELGGASSRKTEGLRMNFCACDRGRQLEKLVPQQGKK